MARFLMACWAFDTHSDVFIAVGNALRAAGHDVALYTAPRLRSEVEAIGARLFPFEKLSQEYADHLVDGLLRCRRRPWQLWQWWRRFLFDTIPAQVEDLNAAIAAYSPDVLVGDTAMWSLTLVLRETARLPIAMLSHVGFCLQHGDAGPLHGPAMPPRRTALQRLAASGIEMLSSFSVRDARRLSTRFRAGYGLPPLDIRMTDLLGCMDLYLIPGCPSFDYSRDDLPPSVRYIGSCEWPPAPQKQQRIPRSRPRLLVEEGGLYAEETVLLRCAAAGLADADMDVTLVPGKGREASGLDLGPIASNIRVQPWVPLHGALSSCDLVLTNGNSGMAIAALARGVPLLVVPSILDQAEVAVRVSECGAGIRISERSCTPQRLRHAVQRLLTRPSYRAAAARMASQLSAFEGPRSAVRWLEELVRCRTAIAWN